MVPDFWIIFVLIGMKKTDIKTQVETVPFAHTKKGFERQNQRCILRYDRAFETPDEGDLRKTGFFKDGKHRCLQIFSGLPAAACETG